MTDKQKVTKIEEPIELVEGSDGYLKIVDGEIVPNYDATINIFTEGDIVTGLVVRIDKDEVLVDIGYKSEGVIPVSELSIRKSVSTADEVALGEEIDALVMQKEDADGRLILSKKRAKFEKAWKRIEEAFESGQPVQGNVIEVVKGGLILDLGVRGFLPASLVDIRRVQDLQEYVGQELNCRVIEMNRILSRRRVSKLPTMVKSAVNIRNMLTIMTIMREAMLTFIVLDKHLYYVRGPFVGMVVKAYHYADGAEDKEKQGVEDYDYTVEYAHLRRLH